MKILSYAGGEYLTGDDIAVALLHYGEALADNSTAESVEIPILNTNGTRATAIFLLGPASQIVARSVDSEHEELVDQAAVDDMHARTRTLRPVGRAADPGEEAEPWMDVM